SIPFSLSRCANVASSLLKLGRQPLRRRHRIMRRWQMTQQGLKSLFLVILILASCSAPSDNGEGGGCGGSEASITCLNVTGITPTSVKGDSTNVDARQDQCTDLTGVVTSIEPFGDHNARVTLVNSQFPTTTATGR